VDRTTDFLSIRDLQAIFLEIDFPEYQREPDIWSRDQKQRLIDSIVRRFDIASIYTYRRDDGGLECIDGRQRLNAIVSFLGRNESDEQDDGFPLKELNEISSSLESPFRDLEGLSFRAIQKRDDQAARDAVGAILEYRLTVVYLSGAAEPDEFNLQFLRLNLGTLINAGEKLHAMVGGMRDVLFESDRIGRHPFFELVRIPTRRYAREQLAAQVLLQAFARRDTGEFARARHFDLQRFVKTHEDVTDENPLIRDIALTLDALHEHLGEIGALLRNRAMTLSAVLLAWERELARTPDGLLEYRQFLGVFLGRLRWQVENMKAFSVDERYSYLVEFQRHPTQASVERPAVTRRDELLSRELDQWMANGSLTGDTEYREDTGEEPPAR
jgi:Protein of unknown function DUF262